MQYMKRFRKLILFSEKSGITGFHRIRHHGFVLGPLSRFSPALPKTRDTIR